MPNRSGLKQYPLEEASQLRHLKTLFPKGARSLPSLKVDLASMEMTISRLESGYYQQQEL